MCEFLEKEVLGRKWGAGKETVGGGSSCSTCGNGQGAELEPPGCHSPPAAELS